jgi:hypothetical protein
MSKARGIQRAARLLAIGSLFWAALLAATGGFDVALGWLVISAHDPYRPLLPASVAATIYILAGGAVAVPRWVFDVSRTFARSRRAASRLFGPRALACVLAAATTAVGWVWGTKAVGGADSYGYLSQSELWATGTLKIRQPIAAEVPWPSAGWTFAPVGSYRPMNMYRRVEGEDRWSIVPLYPPGLPLMLAAVGAIGGHQAKFLVVPLLAGLLVLVTYTLGERLVSPAAGLIAAWLMATNPTFLFMMMPVMSDLPVSTVLVCAFYFAIGAGPWRSLAAGALASLTVLIRPNLAPVAAIMALAFAVRFFGGRGRSQAVRDAACYVLGGLPAAVFLALFNTELYGSPTMTGYGPLGTRFSLDYVGTNIRQYVVWLVQTETPVALFGMGAALIPSRRLWTAPGARQAVVVSAAIVFTIWATYLVYEPFDAWWFLRFLLPTFPFIALGVGALAVAVRRRGTALAGAVAALVVMVCSVFQISAAIDGSAFTLWQHDRRNVAGGRMVRAFTDRDSLIIGGEHTGSVRYYGGRMTAMFLFIPNEWVDRSIAWLDRHGIHPYLYVEEWELPDVRKQFEGQRAAAVLDRPPLAVFRDPGVLYLFDLLEEHETSRPIVTWTGIDQGVWAAPPAPQPRLTIRE